MQVTRSAGNGATGGEVTSHLVSQAEHARLCGVSRKSVTAWKASGQLVMVGELVDHAASYKGERYKASVKAARREEAQPAAGHAIASTTARPGRSKASPTMTATRREFAAKLRALDWRVTPDWSDAAQRQRVLDAAAAFGLVAVEDDAPDGVSRHGFWQLRSAALLARHGGPCTEAVIWGFGFELDDHDALYEIREHLVSETEDETDLAETVTLPAAALQLLAYPLSPYHKRPT